jgi:hypothetical protein
VMSNQTRTLNKLTSILKLRTDPMSVVTLIRLDDGLYMAGDGRTTSGNAILTDKADKVHVTNDGAVVYGIVGACADEIYLHGLVNKYGHDLSSLHHHLNNPELINKFMSFAMLIVNDKQIGLIDSYSKGKSDSEEDSISGVGLIQLNVDELPMCIGSADSTLRAIIEAINPRNVKQLTKCFTTAYRLNNTIGGVVTYIECPYKGKEDNSNET